MFEDLGRIFRKSVSAFRTELNRQEPEDQVAELLMAMRREWVAAKAELPVLAESVERARRELANERKQLEDTERRGKLAEGIGDAETVKVATEFAARHRQRIGVLEQKVAAAQAEQTLRANEVEEMKRRYQEADNNRFTLLAEFRRRQGQLGTQATAEAVDDSFSDFDRMAERMSGESSYLDALDELDSSPPPPRGPHPSEVEERLQELKRRMGKE